MNFRNQANILELTPLERVSGDLPTPGDIRLRVKVEVEGFSGLSDQIWIQKSTLDRFVKDAVVLEQRRQGEATLESMSPGEFVLHLCSVDRAGHLMARGQLRRSMGSGHEQELRFAFELDAETMETSVYALRREFAA